MEKQKTKNQFVIVSGGILCDSRSPPQVAFEITGAVVELSQTQKVIPFIGGISVGCGINS